MPAAAARASRPLVLSAALVLSGVGGIVAPIASPTAAAAGTGNVLVVMAHPDDEALGAAGVIAQAKAAGRRVYVAIVTNGDARPGSGGGSYCGTTSSVRSAYAQFGLARNAETIDAMGLLGLTRTTNPSTTDIFFLGYPDQALTDIAHSGAAYTGSPTGLTTTYALDGDTSTATCNGELRYLLSARHSSLTSSELAADFDSLLTLTNPTDIYTHADFDGHEDHGEVYQQVVAAAQRKSMTPLVHATLIHPEGTEDCGVLSATQWPNPALANNNPFARFTPTLSVTAPPVPTCSDAPTSTSWGSAGPPTELVEVPASMQATTEATNLKWRVIEKFATQIDCTAGTSYPASCGYMRAFVKKHEFFWTYQVTLPTPAPPGSNQLGITSVGPLIDRPAANFKFGSPFNLTQTGTLQRFNFYARGGDTSQSFVPVVYSADANGNPGALVAQAPAVTVAAGSVASWRQATLPTTTLPAGNYVLALVAGPNGGSAVLYRSGAANGGVYNPNDYPTPANPWGTVLRSDSVYSMYVDYTPPSQDATNPTVAVTAPSAGATVSGTTTVTATASDNVGVARVEFFIDGSVVDTDTTSPYQVAWNTSTATNGSHTITARAFDAAGNSATSSPVNVTVSNAGPPDTVPPVASITSPANSTNVTGTTTVMATASDNVGVNRVDLLLDGIALSTDSSSPYTFTWDTTAAGNGAHSLTVKAYDAAGNVGTSAAVGVTVANGATRSFGESAVGASTDKPGIGYRFGSTFGLSEPAQVQAFEFYALGGTASQKFIPLVYAVDGSGNPTNLIAQGAEVTVGANSAAAWRVSSLPATTLPVGSYMLAILSGPSSGASTLYFTSSTNAGMYNANSYPTPATTWGAVNRINARYSFRVTYLPTATDTQAPAVSVTAPAGGTTVSAVTTVTATATDNVAVDRVEFLVDGAVARTDTTSPYTFDWDTAGVANGQHVLSAKGYDAAGNVGTSSSVTVTVNNVPILTFGATTPGTQLDSPPEGYRFGSIFALADTANVVSFKFYARGGSSAQRFVPAIYSVDANGIPTTLAAKGAEVTVAAGAPAGWQVSNLPAATLPPGNYLLSVLSGPGSGGATLYFASETGGGRWAANAYPNPAATWGPVNVGNARYSFSVTYQPVPPDTQNPSVAITSPAAGATASGTVTVTATASDNVAVSKVELLVDGTLVATDTASPYSFDWNSQTVANGSRALTARATDPAGNTATSAAVNVTVSNAGQGDTTAPTASLTAPANGAAVTGTVTVSATASDNVGVTRVEFLANGTVIASDTTSPYQISWNTTSTADGPVTLLARAVDAAGNTGNSPAVNVTVANSGDRTFGETVAGSLQDQASSGYKIGSPFILYEPAILSTFRFHAVGGSSDQAFVPAVYTADQAGTPGNLVATGSAVTVAAGSAASWRTGALPGNTINPGTYVLAIISGPNSSGASISYTSEANAGLYNLNAYPTPSSTWGQVNRTGARYSFQVAYQQTAPDTQAPATSITAPAPGATVSGTITVTATATDNSAVTKVEFLRNGTVVATDTTSPYASTWDTAATANGSYSLTTKAYDISNNVGTSAAVNVTVSNVPDTQSPTVGITSPTNNATVSNITTIAVTATDNVAVNRVEILVDGTVVTTLTTAPYTYSWDTSTVTTGTHHLVARAYDSPGNVGTSATVTVTSITAGPPASDDLSGSLNTTRWTAVNPLGDATINANGTQVEIAVPGGPSHYAWTGGAQAPRLMQNVANADFDVEAKFQSNFTSATGTQIQGILVEQDINNFVRFDIAREGGVMRVSASTVAGTTGTGWFVRDIKGGADIYLRVKRTGSTWTFSYSYDRVSWTMSGSFSRAMTVNRVGPFAGNAGNGSSPAFTANVDYFLNRATPFATEDGASFGQPASPPVIDVWYGDTQTFGQNGRPQQWVNLLGRVSDLDGIGSLTYTLNGGPIQILSTGENAVRLAAPGDFNVEIAYASLNPGANTVVIRAQDTTGQLTLRTVTVNYVAGVTAPSNLTVNWSGAASINSVAQVSDGKWALVGDGTVRTTETGYDRLIELGDMAAWTNYEVTAKVTIWDMPATGAAVGLVAGWTGHTTDQYGVPAPDQPRVGHPFPVFAAYVLSPGVNPRLSIGANTATHQEAELIGDFSGRQLTLGVPYNFKLRTVTNVAGGSRFSFKVWRVGTTEPVNWDLAVDGDRSQGAVVLGAHGADVSFGEVVVAGL